jgi:hypothetical protein
VVSEWVEAVVVEEVLAVVEVAELSAVVDVAESSEVVEVLAVADQSWLVEVVLLVACVVVDELPVVAPLPAVPVVLVDGDVPDVAAPAAIAPPRPRKLATLATAAMRRAPRAACRRRRRPGDDDGGAAGGGGGGAGLEAGSSGGDGGRGGRVIRSPRGEGSTWLVPARGRGRHQRAVKRRRWSGASCWRARAASAPSR